MSASTPAAMGVENDVPLKVPSALKRVRLGTFAPGATTSGLIANCPPHAEGPRPLEESGSSTGSTAPTAKALTAEAERLAGVVTPSGPKFPADHTTMAPAASRASIA